MLLFAKSQDLIVQLVEPFFENLAHFAMLGIAQQISDGVYRQPRVAVLANLRKSRGIVFGIHPVISICTANWSQESDAIIIKQRASGETVNSR